MRSYNERLVLSLLLQNTGITRLEIGEQSGLSAQTVSVIIRSLEQEGLIARGEAQRGRVGPPTVPLSLNPDGAYSVAVVSAGHATVGTAVPFSVVGTATAVQVQNNAVQVQLGGVTVPFSAVQSVGASVAAKSTGS